MMKDQYFLKGKLCYYFLSKVFIDIDEIDYALIKGEHLSKLEFGECGCRDYSDIDILIERKNMEFITESLRRAGFQPVDNSRYKQIFFDLYSHQTIPYYRKIGEFLIYVDINYDIFWGEYEGNRIDMGEFLSDCLYEEIYDYKVKVLLPLKVFVQLILHSYKEMNSLFLLDVNHGYTGKTFQDVYLLLKNNRKELSVKLIREICVRYNILSYAYYVLYYTNVFYEDEWLSGYVNAMENEQGSQLLSCFGLNIEEQRKWKINFEERFEIDDFYRLIKDEYSNRELKKIEINRKIHRYEC